MDIKSLDAPNKSGHDASGFHFRIAVPLIVLLSAATYLNILNNQLFLDDLDFIVNNAFIRDWRYFTRMFTESMLSGAGSTSDYYRPLMEVAFTFGYSLWELNPLGYHFFSILFHVLNGVLLYFLLAGLLMEKKTALLTALLFAVHPAQTESVASASALGILMGMFFALLVLACHVKVRRGPSRWNPLIRAGSLAATAASLLSKETMVIIPGIVFLAEFFFLSEEENFRGRFGKSLLHSIPTLAVVGIYVALRFTVLNFGGTDNLFRQENLFSSSPLVRFYTFLAVLVEFMKIIFWPSALYMERATVVPVYVSFRAMPVIFGFVILCGCLIAVFAAAAAKPWAEFRDRKASCGIVLPFGILWFLFGLVPVSNILIPISTTIVESWLYMTMVGIFLIFSSLVFSFWKSGEGMAVRNGVLAAVLSVILAACMVKAVKQNRVWKDPVTFYEHTLSHAPQSARFRNNLAMAYSDQNRHDEAVKQYLLAIETNDQYPETHHNLANSYLSLGRAADAEREFYNAIRMNPQFFHSYVSLASLYFNLKRLDLAENTLRTLIEKAPSRWEGYYNLGLVYSARGDKDKALSIWREGQKADPYNKLLNDAVQNGDR